jgi:aspartate 1-decarboxylase
VPNESVIVADCENGNRFVTYVLVGEPGSGIIGINGAAARLSQVGHRVIVMSFVYANASEIAAHKARIVIVDERNRVSESFTQKSTLEP